MSLRSSSVRKNQIISEEKFTAKGEQYKESYQIGRMLGKGGFATVFEATSTSDDKKYAVKIIPIQTSKPDSMDKIKTEIKIVSGLNHPGVVKYISSFSDNECIYILLELCINGSLGDMLKKRKHITEPEARFIVYQMVEIIQYIKSKRIIHRDIKLANIFLDEHFRLKLGDFGLATVDDEEFKKKKSVCGTPNYIAPEVIQKKAYSYEIDVWSTGVLIFTLMFGVAPFETKSCKETYERIRKGSFKYEGVNKNIIISLDARNFISQILQVNPEKRLKIEEFMRHPFMQNYKIPHEVEPSFGISIPTSSFLKKYSNSVRQKKQTAIVKKESSAKNQSQKTMASEISLIAKSNEMKYSNLRNRESYFVSSNRKAAPQLDMIKIEVQENQKGQSLKYQQSCQIPFIPETPKKLKLQEEQENQSNRIRKKFRPNFEIIEQLSSEKIKGLYSISPCLTPPKIELPQSSRLSPASPNIDKSTRSINVNVTKTIVNLVSAQSQVCLTNKERTPQACLVLNPAKEKEVLESNVMASIIMAIKERIQTHPSLIANKIHSQLKLPPLKLNFVNRQKRNQQIETKEVKVVAWLDRWDSYGLAFMLSNKNIGIVFHDHTKIMITRDKKIHFFQRQKNCLRSDERASLQNKSREQLTRRAQYLLLVQQELKHKNPCKYNRDDVPHNSSADNTYVKTFVKSDEMIMFKLSNGNLHCIFKDGSSIFVESSYRFVTYYRNYLQNESKQFCSLPVMDCRKVSDELKLKLIAVSSLYQKCYMNNIKSKALAQNALFGKLYSEGVPVTACSKNYVIEV